MQLNEIWNNQWVNDEKYTYTYDNDGNRLSFLDEDWINSSWENKYRRTLTYIDGDFKDFHEKWTNGAWVNWVRIEYSYDNSHHLLKEFHESWEDGEWGNKTRTTISYDNSFNISKIYVEYWNLQWWYEYQFNYDSHNNLLTEVYLDGDYAQSR